MVPKLLRDIFASFFKFKCSTKILVKILVEITVRVKFAKYFLEHLLQWYKVTTVSTIFFFKYKKERYDNKTWYIIRCDIKISHLSEGCTYLYRHTCPLFVCSNEFDLFRWFYHSIPKISLPLFFITEYLYLLQKQRKFHRPLSFLICLKCFDNNPHLSYIVDEKLNWNFSFYKSCDHFKPMVGWSVDSLSPAKMLMTGIV